MMRIAQRFSAGDRLVQRSKVPSGTKADVLSSLAGLTRKIAKGPCTEVLGCFRSGGSGVCLELLTDTWETDVHSPHLDPLPEGEEIRSRLAEIAGIATTAGDLDS